MKANLVTTSILVCGAALAVPSPARAEEPPGAYSYAWHDSRLRSDFGVSAVLGAGVTGFTNQTMRDSLTSSVGGLWNLRATIGSHTPLGVDVAYVGTAADINALIGTRSGTLVGTAVEAALRFNILPHNDWNPYVAAGLGWQRYDVTGATFQLSDSGMNDHDNSVIFPFSAGVAYRDTTGLVFDLHGIFRANANQGLVLEKVGGSDYAPMHSWEASAALGYEF